MYPDPVRGRLWASIALHEGWVITYGLKPPLVVLDVHLAYRPKWRAEVVTFRPPFETEAVPPVPGEGYGRFLHALVKPGEHFRLINSELVRAFVAPFSAETASTPEERSMYQELEPLWHDLDGLGFFEGLPLPGPRRPGRPKKEDREEFIDLVILHAAAYVDGIEANKTRAEIAKALLIGEATLDEHVQRARHEFAFITKVRPGQKGGLLTPKGRQRLARARKRDQQRRKGGSDGSK